MAVRNIKRPRQFLTPADIAFILGIIILVGGLFVANMYVAKTLKGGEWLFLRWTAARRYVINGLDPYDATVAQQVQSFAYGREAYLNEYPFALNDPFYVVLLFVPLSLISDFSIAHAIWMLLSQAALIAIVLLTLRLSEWQPPIWMAVCLIAFALLGSFSVLSFVSGSSALFVTLLALLSLRAIQTDANEVAGILLALIAYQWEISALFFLFILVYVIANRKWGVLAGFGMSLVTLFLISILLNSNWIVPYVRATLLDWSRRADYTFGTTLSYIFPKLTVSVDQWITIGLSALLFYESIRSVYEHSRHVVWVACLALALNPMLGFAMFPVNYAVMAPAIILVIALVWERWVHQRVWISLLLLLALFTSSYDLYFQTLVTPLRIYSDLLKILPPLITTLGLYWMRWWAIRAPRLWADQFGVRK
jgi:glycosyl transferase family 87